MFPAGARIWQAACIDANAALPGVNHFIVKRALAVQQLPEEPFVSCTIYGAPGFAATCPDPYGTESNLLCCVTAGEKSERIPAQHFPWCAINAGNDALQWQSPTESLTYICYSSS